MNPEHGRVMRKMQNLIQLSLESPVRDARKEKRPGKGEGDEV